MRFLNRKWASGQYDELRAGNYYCVYLRHVQDIADDLPDELRAFAMLTHGHAASGATIWSARLRDREQVLSLRLLLQDSKGKKWLLRLRYLDVDVELLERGLLARLCRDPETRCLTDEVDLAPEGRVEHRILFAPDGEIAIRFRGFDFVAEPAKGRQPLPRNRFAVRSSGEE
ncbi:MAG: hypothetical protein IT463_13075 [Planctomycetes bacterium]|nr:hypothetical protein [Planctomycetota bacterium]